MSNILEDLEVAVGQLSTSEFIAFRTWLDEFEAAKFDARIEADAKAGRLDELAEQARADFRSGHAREI